MAKKQFKTESKKLLDMMVNSIYTNKEIFLRELISNASDAIDKLYFRSLTDGSVQKNRGDFEIRLIADKEKRTLTIIDNGCGMTKAELDDHLGVIAKSGSLDFKKQNAENKGDIDIIGQFGVGFYSAFMVADKITVESRSMDESTGHIWQSSGADGYTVDETAKEDVGTKITLQLKADTDEEKYSKFLEDYTLRMLVKKYSDYIRYPIRMWVSHEKLKEGTENEYELVSEDETLNSMIPLWKKSVKDVSDEEYKAFYQEKFYDFSAPLKTVKQSVEGNVNFDALLFIPSHAPFDFYSKDFEKGLQLYSSGVMIMDKCKDLLPDYFAFVRGVVDSSDLSLNISRELLQQDRQVKVIAKAVEKKIASELKKMLDNERKDYETFFSAFGTSLKFGLYSDYGAHKDVLKDLVLFHSSCEDKMTSLHEYVNRMKDEQKFIYYATGDSVQRIALLPQVQSVLAHGFEVLYLTEDVDEFALHMLQEYDKKTFVNVCKDTLDLQTEEEKQALKDENEKAKEWLDFIKESVGEVNGVRLVNTLQDAPVCLSNEGEISITMEKTLNKMPGAGENKIKAQLILDLNVNHPVVKKMQTLFDTDKDAVSRYAKILYAHARLISGLPVEDPTALCSLVCDLMM